MNGRSEPTQPLDVLLVEDNPADARFVRLALSSSGDADFAITETPRLEDALQALATGAFDIVLLDLGLPDSRGLATFSVLHARFRLVPVVVVSALADEATMRDAVRLGAQDYVIKGDFNAALLVRVLRHAVERHRLVQQLERTLTYVRALLQTIEGSAHPESPAGSLAMCGACKRVRAAAGRWETVDEYLAPLVQAQLTYETCHDCVEKLAEETRGTSGLDP
jgi:DNA-binding response OmpR family regulator